MPTIWRGGGFRFVIWPDDHHPPHVHIVRGNRVLAIVNMAIGGRTVWIRENFGLKRQELASVVRVVASNNDLFMMEWTKLHGES